jgi:hypothetical protein
VIVVDDDIIWSNWFCTNPGDDFRVFVPPALLASAQKVWPDLDVVEESGALAKYLATKVV